MPSRRDQIRLSDDELRAWTYAASQKAKNLDRDPRATISIDESVQ